MPDKWQYNVDGLKFGAARTKAELNKIRVGLHRDLVRMVFMNPWLLCSDPFTRVSSQSWLQYIDVLWCKSSTVPLLSRHSLLISYRSGWRYDCTSLPTTRIP